MLHKNTQTDFEIYEKYNENNDICSKFNFIPAIREFFKENFNNSVIETYYQNDRIMDDTIFEKISSEMLIFSNEPYNFSNCATKICTLFLMHKHNEKSKFLSEIFRFFDVFF